MTKYGPRKEGSPALGKLCLACGKPFVVGDFGALIALGPGGNPEARELAKKGERYTAVAVEIHFDCADPRST
jgi:hypothetical protein